MRDPGKEVECPQPGLEPRLLDPDSSALTFVNHEDTKLNNFYLHELANTHKATAEFC